MKAAAKKSTRKAEPDVRRRILRASRVLIEREGLSALSMREVARRAGVSHQAPYNHFPDREAILGALAEEGFLLLRDKLVVILESSEDTSERIRAGLRGYVEFAVQYPAHFRLMFRPELVDLDNCPGAKEAGDKVFTMFTDVVKELVPTGPASDALIALCWSVCHGLACLILDGPLTRKLPDAEHEVIIAGVTSAFAAMLATRVETRSETRVATRKSTSRK